MDLSVAIDTDRVREVASPMTFGAQVPRITADEHKSIDGSMGLVTDGASFHLLREMLVDPRPTLFRMTFKAGFLLGIEVGLTQARPLARSVRTVAVRTFQSSLEDPVRIL